MAIPADCCAGETKRRVTDRGAAYATLVRMLGSTSPDDSQGTVAETEERVVALTLTVLSVDAISLDKLIALRQSERKSGGQDLRKARHNYVDKIEAHLNRLATLERPSDRRELERVFEQDVRDDGLKIALKDAIFSKEMLTAFVVGAGTVAAAVLGTPVTMTDVVTPAGASVSIGGVLGVRNKFFKARKDLLARHPMAYLYEAKGRLRL
jgi:hypothetical protein